MRIKNFVLIATSFFILNGSVAFAAPVVDANQPLVQDTNADTAQTVDTSNMSIDERMTRLEQMMGAQGPMQLLTRMNQLQQQVEILQGQNEVLRHQVQQLQQGQRKMYMDLDQRITALESGKKMVNKPSFNVNTLGGGDDQAAYQKAYNLIAAREYPQAITALQAFIKQFPKSQYAPNAYYWQGEVLAAQADTKQALGVFQQLIKQFPNSAKVPDAKFKIAMLAVQNNQVDDARTQLQAIVSQYPNSTAANLAANQLRQLKGQ